MKLFDTFLANPGADLAIEEIATKAAGSKDLAGKVYHHAKGFCAY